MIRDYEVLDRRTAIKLLGTGFASATAGCIGSTNSPTTRGNKPSATPTTDTASESPTNGPSDTQTSAETPTTPHYQDWTFGLGLVNGGLPEYILRVDPNTIQLYRDRLNDTATKKVRKIILSALGLVPISHDPLNSLLRTQGVYVGVGDFTQRYFDANRKESFERKPPECRGFLLYDYTGDKEWAIAATDGIFLVTLNAGIDAGPVEVLKRAIDTGKDEYERLQEQYPFVEPLASWTGSHTVTQLDIYEPESATNPGDSLGEGIGVDFTDDGVRGRVVGKFRDPESATIEALDEIIETRFPFVEWQDTTRMQHGDTIIMEGKTTYESVLSNE